MTQDNMDILSPEDARELDEKIRIVRGANHIAGLARLMDSAIKIPGISYRLGLDTIIGLLPVIGDLASLGISGYIIFQARRIGLPKRYLVKMIWNVLLDWLIGLVPLIGDIFDWGWKANNRNAAIVAKWAMKKYLDIHIETGQIFTEAEPSDIGHSEL